MAAMDVKSSIKGQYHAGLKMLRQCIERCPNDVWTSGTHPRTFWRIAYHAIFYTHLYLGQNEQAFRQWEKHRDCGGLWAEPPVEPAFSKEETLEYLSLADSMVDPTLDGLDLESEETGFHWYKGMNKLDHELMNFRHL